MAVAAPSGASTEPGSGTECEDVGLALAATPAHPGAGSGDFVMVRPDMGASVPVDVVWDDGPDGDMAQSDEQEPTVTEVTCGDLVAGVEPSPEEVERMHEEMLAFARCMRDEGVDLPDPSPGIEVRHGAVDEQERGTPGMSDIDPRDPDFQAAEEECRPEGAVVIEGHVADDPGASAVPHPPTRAVLLALTEA